MMRVLGIATLAAQLVLLLVLLARLAPGRTRRKPMSPHIEPSSATTVSVIVATLDEAKRIGPCLHGLSQQVAPMLEVLVVDSNSTDGTRELVLAAARTDTRIRLLTDAPLPDGWVGKVWALEHGLREARGAWVLGIDADTIPVAGMVGAVVTAAEADGFDVASFAPKFTGQGTGERWLQPAMLVTLVYRCGAAGATQPSPQRVLANGQCFLARRDLLLRHGGYSPARASFSDDVTLARYLAARGARVGFLDGSRVIGVQGYAGVRELWREWGRSFDLKDATPSWRRWLDVALVWSVQALPLPMLVLLTVLLFGPAADGGDGALLRALALVNASAGLVRLMMLFALRDSYARRGVAFWCSWLADIPAAWRLTLSTMRVPRMWRGRRYGPTAAPAT